MFEENKRKGITNLQTLDEAQAVARNAASAYYDLSQAVEQQKEVARGWAQQWVSAGDSVSKLFADVLVNGKSLLGGLKDIAKQTVTAIIEYFAKLAFINPILNSVFGGQSGFSMLPMMANAFGGATPLAQTGSQIAVSSVGTMIGGYSGGASGGILGSVGSTVGSAITSAFGGSSGGSQISSLFSPTSWATMGKNLWGGFSTGFDKLFGAGSLNPSTGEMFGQGFFNGGSAWGTAANTAAGAYAGWQLGSQLGGTAGGILGAGALGVAAYMVPVVGWIAGAASLINSLTGGGLFGTSWKGTGNSKQNLAFGESGLSIANAAEEKKKKMLFGGSKTRWDNVAVTDEQKDYIAQFNAAMDKVRESAASALGGEVAGIVTGAFEQHFDKDGKVTSEISTVLGKTYKESIDDFAQRMQGENLLAQIDASRGDSAASQIADQYRNDAAKLNEAAQMLLAAQVDINHASGLLGADTGLADVAAIVNELSVQDETLIATYQRLQQESQTLRNALDLTGADIGKTGAEFVKFADAAARAAGGADALTQLTQTFAQAFYSAEELAVQNIKNLGIQADKALSGLGLDPDISKADFRAAYEAALPTLTPEQFVEWQQAGIWLAQYTDALQQQADTIKSTLAQMDATAGIADPNAGTWAATLDAINAQFDAAIQKLKDLGATSEDLARAEFDRQQTIENAYAAAADSYTNIVRQLRDGMAALDGAGQSDIAAKVAEIRAAEQATVEQMNAAALAAGMEAAAEGDLALAHDYANAQITKLASEYLTSLGIMAGGTSEFGSAIAAIRQAENAAIDAATALAQAQGREGANAAEVARIHLWAANQIAAAMAQLQAKTQDLISQLYGGPAGTLDLVNQQIAALESSMSSMGTSAGNAASSIDNASKALADQQKLLYGDLSPYNDNERLGFAKDAYLQGNASADDVLRIAQRLYSSSNDYKDVFDWVMANPQAQAAQDSGMGAGAGGAVGGGGSSAALDALYKQRDELQAAAALEQRKAWAQELIQNIADMAAQNHIDALTQMDILGVKLPDVVRDLGIDIKNLDANGVLGLANVAQTLGVNMGDVLGRLGIGFGDLYTGLIDLTERMGIDLGNIDATNLQKLADLASVLGIGMGDLLEGLHMNLGDISFGIEQMVDRLGIDLTNISADNVQSLADLAGSLGLSLSDVVAALHLSLYDLTDGLRALAERQGIDLANIDANNVKALAEMAEGLHLSLGDMITALQLNLSDVVPGLRELTAALGINLADLNEASIASLGNLAGQLNTDLGSLMTALGIGLQDIAPGLLSIATGMGINLAALTESDAQKLAELASSLHINLGDLGTLLGINLDAVTQASQAGLSDVEAALNGNLADLGAALASSLGDVGLSVGSAVEGVDQSVADMLAATLDRARADEALQAEIAGFTDSTDEQTAVLYTIAGGIAELPAAMPDNGDMVAALNTIAANTRDGATAAAASATNTNSANRKLDDVSAGINGLSRDISGLSSQISTVEFNTRT
jgi:hypothetical protein